MGLTRDPGTRALPLCRFMALSVTMCAIAWPAFANDRTHTNKRNSLVSRGALLFITRFTPEQGLGPLFNGASCVTCHATPTVGGMGPNGLGTATRVGQLTSAGLDPLIGLGGPIARAHSVTEGNKACDLVAGIPARANVTSVRNAPDLHGTGVIDAIPDAEIAARAVPQRDGVRGRPNWVITVDGRKRIGRFGWKADTATLREFVANAFRNELGITSPLAPMDLAPIGQSGRHHCPGESSSLEDDGTIVDAVTAFVAALSPPNPHMKSLQGAALFSSIGCDACHRPSLSPGKRRLWLYSDLLLHDLGPDLDDKMRQGSAEGHDWRTTPLWGLHTRLRLLHDGRARTISEAILAHGGEGARARLRFRLLPEKKRDALLRFLRGL
jgi:CxxC motif-containing protein (DUF1111 family)